MFGNNSKAASDLLAAFAANSGATGNTTTTKKSEGGSGAAAAAAANANAALALAAAQTALLQQTGLTTPFQKTPTDAVFPFFNPLLGHPALAALAAQQQLAAVSQQLNLNLSGKSKGAKDEADTRSKQRLERNRKTAQLRRQRRKQEAEQLTATVTALRVRLKELTNCLEQLNPEEKEKAIQVVQSFGEPPLACQFCSHTFGDQTVLNQHMQANHTQDLKQREQYAIESKKFGMNADGEVSAQETSKQEAELSRLSTEERKKRRLERNALSARLCRLRKKIYSCTMRAQLPGLRHRVKSLEAALPTETVERISKSTPVPDVLDLEREASSTPSLMRTFSAESAASMSSTISGGSLAGSKRKLEETALKQSSSSDLTQQQQQEEPEKKVCKVETKKEPLYAADKASALLGLDKADIPPMNGWSKSSRRSSTSGKVDESPLTTMTTFGNLLGLSPFMQGNLSSLPSVKEFALNSDSCKKKGNEPQDVFSAALALSGLLPK